MADSKRGPVQVRPAQRVANDRSTGYGMIQPGAGGDYDHPQIPTTGDFFGGMVNKMRNAKASRDSLANDQENRRQKVRGEAAYWTGSPSKTKAALSARMAGR